jgi:hypothetical protein
MSRTFLIGIVSHGSGTAGVPGLVAATGGERKGLVAAADAVEQLGLVDQVLGNQV